MKLQENTYEGCKNVVRNHTSIVYFLLSDGEVVYIGKTKNLPSRKNAHKANKIFNKVHWLECDPDLVNEVESSLIRKYKPKYNVKDHPEPTFNASFNNNGTRRVYVGLPEDVVQYVQKLADKTYGRIWTYALIRIIRDHMKRRKH